jgi:hypothetical protein
MKKLAPYYCLAIGCACGGKRAFVPLPPKAARNKHRREVAAAMEKHQAYMERAMVFQQQAMQLATAPAGGNA